MAEIRNEQGNKIVARKPEKIQGHYKSLQSSVHASCCSLFYAVNATLLPLLPWFTSAAVGPK